MFYKIPKYIKQLLAAYVFVRKITIIYPFFVIS